MTDLPIRGRGPQGVRPTDAAAPARGATPEGGSPAFRALLESLEARAADLRAKPADSPDDLAGAVDRARASLEDALDLKDRLLEAYRADRTRRGGDGEPGREG
jgi:hypothetical protein